MGATTQKISDTNTRDTLPAQWQEEESHVTLKKILDKLDKIERTVNKFGHVVDQAPEALTIATNFIDNAAERMRENGQNMEEKAVQSIQLLDRLTRPETVQKLNALLEGMEHADDMISFAVDQVDELMMTLQNHGLEPKEMSEDSLKFLFMIVNAHRKAIKSPTQKVGWWGMLRTLSDPDFQKFLGYITTLGKNFGKGF